MIFIIERVVDLVLVLVFIILVLVFWICMVSFFIFVGVNLMVGFVFESKGSIVILV